MTLSEESPSDKLTCPLCSQSQQRRFSRDSKRDYLRCEDCALVWVPARYHLSADAEKAEYDLHNNRPDDPGYRKFLSRLVNPLRARLAPSSRGLDFGCGPGPTLALMLEEAGHKVALYDHFYFPNPEALKRNYDFICATEVVEHLHQPGSVLTQLWSILEAGGTLAIMTKLVLDKTAFEGWHYKNDPTHVSFFSRATFDWLARQLNAELEFIGSDVILLRKLSSPQS